MDNNKDPEVVLKLLLLGDSLVGKTSILVKYINDKFDSSSISTIGVDYMDKIIDYKNIKIKLQIWDTSGQEKFRSITKNFYRNTDGLFVVFDLTKKESYDHVRSWIIEAKNHNESIKPIILGNKSDLSAEREVKNETATNFANRNNLKYLETSAKNGNNINEAFDAIVDLLLNGKSEKEILDEYIKQNCNISVQSDNNEKKKIKKGCC